MGYRFLCDRRGLRIGHVLLARDGPCHAAGGTGWLMGEDWEGEIMPSKPDKRILAQNLREAESIVVLDRH